MNSSNEDQELDNQALDGRLRETLGPAPTPDFNAWQQKHSDALATLLPVRTQPQTTTSNWRLTVIAIKSLAASLLVICSLAWLFSGGVNIPATAFADEIPGIDNVQTMSWTDIYYIRFTSKDGQRTWIQEDQRKTVYRHPGQSRETRFDQYGNPVMITITDLRAGRSLVLDIKEKKATLKLPVGPRFDRTPFAWVGDLIRDRQTGSELTRVQSISILGKREIDKKQVNTVRAITRNSEYAADNQTDFFFNPESRQLVGILDDAACSSGEANPGYAHIPFDPDTAIDRSTPAEKSWSKMIPVGRLTKEISLAPSGNSSDFSLDVPSGYALEKLAQPTVTEEEMVSFLGASARFNNNRFPDSPHVTFDSGHFNAASGKLEREQTAGEKELITIRDRILMREIFVPPLKKFEEDHTVAKSFHYVGSGVIVGQSDRLVAWYKLRSSNKYRAIYGDLSVKDIAESDLPLSTASK